jgi:hypothetical protein
LAIAMIGLPRRACRWRATGRGRWPCCGHGWWCGNGRRAWHGPRCCWVDIAGTRHGADRAATPPEGRDSGCIMARRGSPRTCRLTCNDRHTPIDPWQRSGCC